MSPQGDFVPHVERPEPRTALQERLEGQQLSRLYYLMEPGPTGSYGLALELTTGAKLVVWAGRDRNSIFSARLLFRWLEPPLIVLPRMERAFAGGRDGTPEAEAPDELQRLLEGEVVTDVRHFHTPTVAGGEQIEFAFKGGRSFHVAALPVEKRLSDGRLLLADLDWSVEEPERIRIVMP